MLTKPPCRPFRLCRLTLFVEAPVKYGRKVATALQNNISPPSSVFTDADQQGRRETGLWDDFAVTQSAVVPKTFFVSPQYRFFVLIVWMSCFKGFVFHVFISKHVCCSLLALHANHPVMYSLALHGVRFSHCIINVDSSGLFIYLFIDLTVLSLRDYVQEINTATALLFIVLTVLCF